MDDIDTSYSSVDAYPIDVVRIELWIVPLLSEIVVWQGTQIQLPCQHPPRHRTAGVDHVIGIQSQHSTGKNMLRA